jgi:erythromycin esterase-like protein
MAAYVVSTFLTNMLTVNLSASVFAFLLVCYGSMQAIANHLRLPRTRVFAVETSTISILVVALLVTLPTLREYFQSYPDTTSETLLAILQDKTFKLDTVYSGNEFDDLQPLQAILRDRDTRIVALGEATHGTSEFFRMKHRLLEFLVREMGFQHFGMELSPTDGQALNAYLMGHVDELPHVLYWPWATAEVVEMLNWMRTYNDNPNSPHQITIHGIDPSRGQRDAQMAGNVNEMLNQLGPESKIVLWAHNAHISNAAGMLGHHLKQRWGEQVYLLGFEFNHGAFTSRFGTVHVYSMDPASPAYYAYALSQLNEPILFLDFRTMAQDTKLQAWLAQPQYSHDIQELHAIFRLNPDWHTRHTSWLQLYDGVIYIEESAPALGLP